MRALSSLWLVGLLLCPRMVSAVEPPPQTPPQAIAAKFPIQPQPDFSLWLQGTTDSTNAGVYRFTFRAQAVEPATTRLWIARSTTADFSNTQWQEMPSQIVNGERSRFSYYNLLREAEVKIDANAPRYFAVQGELEVSRDGTVQRFFSATTVFPRLHTNSFGETNGSRRFYVTPSEKSAQTQLKFAYSATRDFKQADWQTLPIKPSRNSYGETTYQAIVPAATPAMPWVAVYAETELERASVRVVSPTAIWNGLPFPQPASELRGDICPLHKTSDDVVPIIYGMAMSGGPPGAIYAGCIVGPDSPTHHCNRCDCDWGDLQAEAEAARQERINSNVH